MELPCVFLRSASLYLGVSVARPWCQSVANFASTFLSMVGPLFGIFEGAL